MRNIENADALVNGAYQAFNARVQLIVVPDITAEGVLMKLFKVADLSLVFFFFWIEGSGGGDHFK